MGADGIATMGSMGVSTVEQQFQKIEIYKDRMLIGISGSVGLGQRLMGELTHAWDKDLHKQDIIGARTTMREAMWKHVEPELKAATVSAQLVGHQTAGSSAICETLIAAPIQKRPVLLHYDLQSASTEVTDELPFESIGSGKQIADPFLAFLKRTLWRDACPATLGEGIFAILWTLFHVMQYHPSGGIGGKPQIVVLKPKGEGWIAEELEDANLEERRQAIGATEIALHDYVRGIYPMPAN